MPIVENNFAHPSLLFRGTFWDVGGSGGEIVNRS